MEIVKEGQFSARVIETDRNLLTSAACNIGANAARGEFIFFIADDNCLDTETIRFLVTATIQTDADIFTPICYFKNETRLVASSGTTISLWTGLSRRPHAGSSGLTEIELNWKPEVIDNAMFMRRDTIFKIGGFDSSNFPMHNEEADFCIRARKQGSKIAVVPSAVIWHGIWPKHGRFGFGNRDFCIDSPLRAYLTDRNRNILVRRHGTALQKLVFFSCFFMPFTIAYVTIMILQKDLWRNLGSYLRGVRDSLGNEIYQFGVIPKAESVPLALPTGDERWAWIYDAN
jgi:hypothetical protein